MDVTPPKSGNIDKGGDPGICIFNEHKWYSDVFCSAHIMRNSGVYAISKGKVFEHLQWMFGHYGIDTFKNYLNFKTFLSISKKYFIQSVNGNIN